MPIVLAACSERANVPEPLVTRQSSQCFPQSINRDLDLLFVIDNSPSMADLQDRIDAQLDGFMQALADLRYGFPDAHIGVVSADLGTGTRSVPGCTTDGDAGRFQSTARGECEPPDGTFIEATSADGELFGNVPDADGNGALEVADVQAAFRCIARLGASGCGYEQPLEAARRALSCTEEGQCTNPGFLRESALLMIVFITDEDDCSAADDAAFDSTAPTEGGCRCFELGVECDATGCAPNEDSPYLHPVRRYYDFFSYLKPRGLVLLATVSGPWEEGATVETITDGTGNCALVPSCAGPAGDGAFPAVRIAHLVRLFEDDGTVLSDEDSAGLCGDDFPGALRRIGEDAGEWTIKCIGEPLIAVSGAPIVHPDEAVCVATEYNDDVPRELPRCVFESEPPVACGPLLESPG